MKASLLALAFGLLTAGSAAAQSKTPPAPAPAPAPDNTRLLAVVTTNKADAKAVARANRLTDYMVRQLHLNNYQSNRLRAINQTKVSQMMDVERQYANDPQKVDSDCQGILCTDRDREIRTLLSTAQYADYYEARNDFYKFDKQFLAEARDATRRPKADAYAIPSKQTVEIKNAEETPVVRSKGSSD